MNLSELRNLYDVEMRKNPGEFPGYHVDWESGAVRLTGPSPAFCDNCVLFAEAGNNDLKELIDNQIQHFKKLKHNFEWKTFSHDRQEALEGILLEKGFSKGDEETIVVFDTKNLRDNEIEPDSKIVIKKIHSLRELEIVSQVHQAVWGNKGLKGLIESLSHEFSVAPELLSIYAAYIDDKPVACGWLRFQDRKAFASLWGGSVRTEFRRRGVYRALVYARLKEAASRNVQFVTVDALPTSRPILEKIGFETLTTTVPYYFKI